MVELVKHPIFARYWGRVATAMEARGGSSHREELLDGSSGRVIEIGAGTGLNFARYSASVTQVIALEPESRLRDQAKRAALSASVPVQVIDGVAEHLPFEDGEFDVAVASLVLCSVTDPHLALRELHRVLRSGGELRFYEHVRSDDPKLARWQDRVNRPWSLIAGGCQANRRTLDFMSDEGFEVGVCRKISFRPSPLCLPISSFVLGRAKRE